MARDWQTYSLSDVYEFSSGLSKPRSEFGYGSGFLSFKDVFHNYFVPARLEQLVNSTGKDQESCSIERGDVFLTRTSETMHELGLSCVALKDYKQATFNGFTKRLRPNQKVHVVPEYAGYYFRSPQFRREVTAMSSLSTRASLNNEMLGRLKIVLPPVEVQSAIGTILKSLDDKIELNRRMNATLEAIARALFQSWFVDFDPVHAKAAGRQPVGMDEATAALFPDSFQESELGEIPSGWEVSNIGTEAKVVGGLTPSTKCLQFWENGEFHWVTPKDFSSLQSKMLINSSRKITQAGLDQISSGLLPENTVLLSSRAPVGYLALTQIETAINQGFIAMICNGRLPPEYVMLWADSIMEKIKQAASGTTFAEISKATFRPFRILVPSKETLNEFTRIVRPLFQSVAANERQSVTLAGTRDTLLPKLLAGDLCVVEFANAG